MDREQHLRWAKERALEYLDEGELANAYTSMASDLTKHPELKGIAEKTSELGLTHLISKDGPGLRRWIEGFR